MHQTLTPSKNPSAGKGLTISCRRASDRAIFAIEVDNSSGHALPLFELELVFEYAHGGEPHRQTKPLVRYSPREQKFVPTRALATNESATYVLRHTPDIAKLQSLAAAATSDCFYVSVCSDHEEIDRIPGMLFGSILSGIK